MVEDGWVRREAGHGKLVDVALEFPGDQQVACDVVEPDALTQIVQRLCGFHGVTL
jgi:hypothetical protein